MTQYIPPTYQPPTDPQRPRAISNTAKYIPEAYGGPSQPHTPAAPGFDPSHGRARGPSIAGQPITSTPPVPNPGYYGSSPSQNIGVTQPAPNAGQLSSSPGYGYFGTSPQAYPQGYLGTPQGGGTPYPSAGASPYPQAGASPYQHSQLHPGYPGAPTSQPYTPPVANVDRDGYMRPPIDQRRGSVGSTHSRHSHHSGRSHHSGSHRSHHSHDARRDSHGHRRHSEDSYDNDDDHGHKHSGDHRRGKENKYDDDRDIKPIKRVTSHRPSWGDTIYGMFGVIKDALGPRDKY